LLLSTSFKQLVTFESKNSGYGRLDLFQPVLIERQISIPHNKASKICLIWLHAKCFIFHEATAYYCKESLRKTWVVGALHDSVQFFLLRR